MATDAHIRCVQSHIGMPSPNLKYEDGYSPRPWATTSCSNRSPIPEVKDENFDEPSYNSNHSFYTTISNSTYSSDMGSITYQPETSLNSDPTYSSCRSKFSASPAPERRSSLFNNTTAQPMTTMASTMSPSLSIQRKSHYASPSMGSPNIYGSSPRTSGLSLGSTPIFPSQLNTKVHSELNPLHETQTSSLPSSFLGSSNIAPPAMNRTHSGTTLKPSEKRYFNGPDSLPQISFHQNHPDAPPPSGIKSDFEATQTSLFNQNGAAYTKAEYENIPPMYSIALPGMGSIHPTPYTNGTSHNTYFSPVHIDDVPAHQPAGLLGDAFGEPNEHGFRKRDYHMMEGYATWQSSEGLQIQKPSKRRKSSANQPWKLSDDDRYLMKLKDDEQLPWKEIVNRFRDEGRGTHRVPALQMRLKRIKERIRQWSPEDEKLLEDAKKWLDKHYWEIVSGKMVEYGRKDKIPGTSCEKKWKELNARRESERDSKSGSGRLLHDELPSQSLSQSTVTTPVTNYSGYEEDEETS